MRGEIVRRFCRVVGPDFFHTSPGDYGASRYFFEIGFPNIASMQGFAPFIDPDVAGANSSRDDVWLTFDPKQNHRLARIELERWQRDPFSFTARPLPEAWEPAPSA
jgi:hypothetical protein